MIALVQGDACGIGPELTAKLLADESVERLVVIEGPDDVIAIQEEIAVRIATALETAMDPEALAEMMSAGTRSVPAYEAYLLGNGAIQAGGESGDVYLWLDARDAFEDAVAIDPDFSAAYARLHLFWALQLESNQIIYGLTDLSYEERLAKREEALNNAIRSERDATTLLRYQALQAEAGAQTDFGISGGASEY